MLELHSGQTGTEAGVRAFVRDLVGSVKAPKQVEAWPDLPRSKLGEVLEVEVRSRLLPRADSTPRGH